MLFYLQLKIYESRIQNEVLRYIELPRTLATTGTVELSKKEIHMLIGTIFLEKCAVNLLTTVLDTPEFFWDASDALCTLYDAIFEYLEVADRVENVRWMFKLVGEENKKKEKKRKDEIFIPGPTNFVSLSLSLSVFRDIFI